MIMTRITSNMIRRNYQNNLTNTLGGLESARKQVETGRRFSQSWEDPNAAAKAAILERRYARVEDQIGNVDFAQKWQDTQEDVVGSLSTMATIVAKDYSVRDVNGTNIAIESRSAYAQGLRSMQEQMVTTLNAKYGDTFVLAGNEGKSPPFAIDDEGYLTYRGTRVKDIEDGDPLLNEHSYIDLGFGLDVERTQVTDANGNLAFRDENGNQIYEDQANPGTYIDAQGNPVTPTSVTAVYDTSIAPASAFDTALPGIKLIGYGTITVETGKYVQDTDANGDPLFDADGNPVYKEQPVQAKDKAGNPLYTSADGNNTKLYMKDGKYYNATTNQEFTPAAGQDPLPQHEQATDSDGRLIFTDPKNNNERVYKDANGDFFKADGTKIDPPPNEADLTPKIATEYVPETKEISRNLVDLCGELARVMELPEGEFTYDEYAIYWDEFTDGANKLRDQFAALGTKTQLLTATKTRLENEKLAIQTQYDDAVGINPAEAIMNYSWANYAYNSALKVGASLITPSLLDFIN